MKLTLTSREFCNFLAATLYDHLLHPDEIVPIIIDPAYNDLITVFKHRSMRTILQQYYMQMTPMNRIRYQLAKDVFRNSNKTGSVFIEIVKEHLPVEKKKESFVRRTGTFFAKVLSLGLLDKK